MSFEDELKDNFAKLNLETLTDIVENKKDEYTEEAFKIAIDELTSRTSYEFVDSLLNKSEKEEIILNTVDIQPDEIWISITSSEVNSAEIIEINTFKQYIDILNQNNIFYVTYFSENISGIKRPKYSNKLELYVRQEDYDNASRLLFESNVLLDKEVDDIEELRDVDLDEPLVKEESKLLLTLSCIAFIGINVLLIYLCTIVANGKIGLICTTIIIDIFFIMILKKKFKNTFNKKWL